MAPFSHGDEKQNTSAMANTTIHSISTNLIRSGTCTHISTANAFLHVVQLYLATMLQCWVQRHCNIEEHHITLTFHVERSDLGAAAATSRVLGRELLQTRDLAVRRRDVDGEQEAEGVDVIANTLKHSMTMFLHVLVISYLTILFCIAGHHCNTCTCIRVCTCIMNYVRKRTPQ